jgi:cyanoexosortase B-associated protein
LSVPGWQPLQHERVTFGSDDWSLQQMTIQPPQQGVSQVVLLLKPQTWHTDQPDVEWLDVKGAQRWTIDSRQSVRWETSAPAGEPPTQVRAKFFRAWNQQQTYAAMQWYAWPGGGDPSVSHWFWADQKVQWQSHQRLPWVAVCLLVPLPPLADIAPSQPAIEQLAQTVQTALQTEIFKQ